MNRVAAAIITVILAAGATGAGFTTNIPAQDLSIERFTLVAVQPAGEGRVEETYSAVVANRGGRGRHDAVGVTAVFQSRSPLVEVLDESLTFGNVRAGASAVSRDTVTIRKPRWAPLTRTQIHWDLSWTSDVLVPEGWAGTWRFDITASDPATGQVHSRESTTDIVRPDDALGLALVREPARCQGGVAGDRAKVGCQLLVIAPGCLMMGYLQLDGRREGDTLHAGGESRLKVHGDCGPLVASGAQRLEILATRISLDTTSPHESATSLAAKLLPSSPLFGTGR